MPLKPYLVCERSSSELNSTVQDNKYVLEGIFTEFGVKNKNGRIYEESEVIPHIEAMQKRISERKLVGELDHPKSFDVSYKNASHVIEELRYDKEKQQVIGRIRLLDTSNGKEAQALCDAGIPLHISSRAAGVVENNGKVRIKKMFTYDLVADPGFENATLKSVNESFGFDPNSLIQLYEVENVPQDLLEEGDKTNKKEMSETNEQFVTVADFNKFTEILKSSRSKELGLIKEELKKLVESAKPVSESTGDSSVYEARIAELEKKNTELLESISSIEGFMDYVVEHLEKAIDYSDLISKTVNESAVDRTEFDKAASYLKLVAETVDTGIEYQKRIVSENNSRWRYQTRINEHTDALIGHSDMIVEAVDSFQRFGDHLATGLNAAIKSQDEMFESIKALNEGKAPNTAKALNESVETIETEEVKIDRISEDNKDIDADIDSILNENASAKEQKADHSKHPFYGFLNKDHREKFDSLDEKETARVVEAFSKNKYFGSQDVARIFEATMNPVAPSLDWLQDMPSEFRSIWENLNIDMKRAIKSQASIRSLDTEYKIRNFWETRDLRSLRVNAPDIKPIPINEDNSSFETDDSYMESVKAGLRKRFNK
jgi:ElaB/YqjD/DUF883 family membrane-anchored ribosome-binding protein